MNAVTNLNLWHDNHLLHVIIAHGDSSFINLWNITARRGLACTRLILEYGEWLKQLATSGLGGTSWSQINQPIDPPYAEQHHQISSTVHTRHCGPAKTGRTPFASMPVPHRLARDIGPATGRWRATVCDGGPPSTRRWAGASWRGTLAATRAPASFSSIGDFSDLWTFSLQTVRQSCPPGLSTIW